MRRHQKSTVAAVGVIAAGALAACGDPITINHDFQSVSALSTMTTTKGNTTFVSGNLLQGPLVNAHGAPIPGTQFVERCAKIFVVTPTGGASTAYSCLATLNTGQKFYVAGGFAPGVFGTLKSLDVAGSPDTIVISPLKTFAVSTSPLGIRNYLVKISLISARKG